MAARDVTTLFRETQHTRRRYRHGHKAGNNASPEYICYLQMIARCENPNSPNYHRYGGRGIKICQSWRDDFVNFLADVGAKPAPNFSLERLNNNGDYEPGNVVWATAKDQANNRRSSRFVEHNGQRLTVAQWSDAIGISQGTLHARLKSGWPIERALTQPLQVAKSRKGN